MADHCVWSSGQPSAQFPCSQEKRPSLVLASHGHQRRRQRRTCLSTVRPWGHSRTTGCLLLAWAASMHASIWALSTPCRHTLLTELLCPAASREKIGFICLLLLPLNKEPVIEQRLVNASWIRIEDPVFFLAWVNRWARNTFSGDFHWRWHALTAWALLPAAPLHGSEPQPWH